MPSKGKRRGGKKKLRVSLSFSPLSCEGGKKKKGKREGYDSTS